MTASEAENPSPYEVRCLRCDVSFPVEQRKCLHCGGPTSRPGRFFQGSLSDFSRNDREMHAKDGSASPDYASRRGEDSAPIEPAAESVFSPGGVVEGSSGITIGDSIRDAMSSRGSQDVAATDAGEKPTSIVGSLVRSLGGFVWVILLIGFSIARSCEN